METTGDLDEYKSDHDLSDLWNTLGSPILLVRYEDNENIEQAMVRHVHGDIWLYVDELNGYDLIEEDCLATADLVPQDTVEANE